MVIVMQFLGRTGPERELPLTSTEYSPFIERVWCPLDFASLVFLFSKVLDSVFFGCPILFIRVEVGVDPTKLLLEGLVYSKQAIEGCLKVVFLIS